jgi:uncharacterized peroxidase-related enzyme
MEKPYIKLADDLPGIVSLFDFDHEVAKPLGDLAEVLLRRPSSLSIGERELIAAFVSKLNHTEFCYGSHGEAARHFMDPFIVDSFLEDEDSEVLTKRLSTLMVVATDVQALDRKHLPEAIQLAKRYGASDQDIHDTVAIAAAFCMYNRYVDGLGTVFKKGDLEKSGASIAKRGYRMTLSRLYHEVLPRFLKRFSL